MSKHEPPTKLDAIAKAMWRRLAPLVDLTSEINVVYLHKACEAHSLYAKANEQLMVEGFTITTKLGGVKPHPAMQAQITSDTRFKAYCKLLGLNEPTTEDNGGDPFDEFRS